jgi:hypothetical protein
MIQHAGEIYPGLHAGDVAGYNAVVKSGWTDKAPS